MFAKLKAWAAEVWQFVKYAMTSEGVKRWMSIAQDLDRKLKDSLDREERYKDQLAAHAAEITANKRAHKLAIDSWQQSCSSLTEQRDTASKNLEQYREERSSLKDETRKAKQEVERVQSELRLLDESRNESATRMAASCSSHMRAAAEWQGQCKRMTLELEALRAVIASTKLAEGELLIVQGNMDGLIKLRQYMAGIPLTKCVFISDKMAAWKATPISTQGSTSATEPAPGPEIASIGDVLTEMNREPVKVPVRIPPPDQLNGTLG